MHPNLDRRQADSRSPREIRSHFSGLLFLHPFFFTNSTEGFLSFIDFRCPLTSAGHEELASRDVNQWFARSCKGSLSTVTTKRAHQECLQRSTLVVVAAAGCAPRELAPSTIINRRLTDWPRTPPRWLPSNYSVERRAKGGGSVCLSPAKAREAARTIFSSNSKARSRWHHAVCCTAHDRRSAAHSLFELEHDDDTRCRVLAHSSTDRERHRHRPAFLPRR